MQTLSDAVPRRVSGDSILAPAFLWLCIPKNASRSLLGLLAPRGRRVGELAPAGQIRKWMKQAALPDWSFAAVRHPAARVVSAWKDKLQDAHPTANHARMLADNPGIGVGMTLDSFIDWLADTVPDSRKIDGHWRPQHHYTHDKDGVSQVRFIARCERLGEDLHAVADRLGGLEDLPWLNRSSDRPAELTARQRTLIGRIYARDFALFGYD